MRRFLWIAIAGLALTGTGVAVADDIDTKAIEPVSATFAATNVLESTSRTCTNATGTFVQTSAHYSGTAASSQPSLNGPLRLRVTSLVNQPKTLGSLHGTARIDTSAARDTVLRFDAVYSNGQVNGFASGHAPAPLKRVLANLSASFDAAGGFTNGRIGDTAAGGAAVALQPGRCRTVGRERVEARGIVSALSREAITVASVTCVVPPRLADRVARLRVGDRAVIRCELIDGRLTLIGGERQGG